ncbi:hypothetical protein FACS1894177_05500 [Bacteroidia bacterium]|nr:hypothetical protein FACS1894177_05500 [Bacteroidia bacterium]
MNDTQGLIVFECVGLLNLETPSPIEIPDKKYLKCSRKELAKLFKAQGASMIYGINGGDITIVGTTMSDSFRPLELE